MNPENYIKENFKIASVFNFGKVVKILCMPAQKSTGFRDD